MESEQIVTQENRYKPEDGLNTLLQSPNPFDPTVIDQVTNDVPFLVSNKKSGEMKSKFRSLNCRMGTARKNDELPVLEALTQQKNQVVQEALWQELPYILNSATNYRNLGVQDHDVLQYAMLASTEAVSLWVYSKDDISLRQAIKTKIKANLSHEIAAENNIDSEDLPLLKLYIDILSQNPDKDDVHQDVLETVTTILPDQYPGSPHYSDYDRNYRQYTTDSKKRSQTEETLETIQMEYDDNLIETNSPNEEFDIDQINLSSALQTALEKLSPQEREVIEKYYGLNGNDEMTMEDLGKIYDVTRERVRQIRNTALRKLRHPSRGLNSYAPKPKLNLSPLEISQQYNDETTKPETPKTTETKTQPLKDWESSDFWRYINTTCREGGNILSLEDTPESINPNEKFHAWFDGARRKALLNDRGFSVIYLEDNKLQAKTSSFSDEFRNPTLHIIGTFHQHVPDVNLRIVETRILFRDRLFDDSPSIGKARLVDLSVGEETLFVANADQKHNYLAIKTSSTIPAENWHPLRLKNFEDTEENTTTMLAADLNIALYRGKPGEPLQRIYPPVPVQQGSSDD